MPTTDLRSPPPTRAYLRVGLILLGFVIVLAASVFTVVLPELSREPDGATQGQTARGKDGQTPAARD